MKLSIDCTGRKTGTITDYLVDNITELIQLSKLPVGTRLPSIRNFATDNKVSRFTVVQVYDRLVADGLLHSRPGSGFYVSDLSLNHKLTDDIIESDNSEFVGGAIVQKGWISAGRGSLPKHWLDNVGLEKAIRKVGRDSMGELLEGYPDISGYLPLREQLRQRLINIGIAADISQIISVSGALPGIDIICRTLVKPGQTVLIDEPGYHMLGELMHSLDINVVGLPWTRQGPDVEQLEELAAKHKPKLFITSGINQNPTNITVAPSLMHQVLSVAEKHNFWIIEDDIFGVFHGESPLRYAALDQLKRVIYVNSYSKTISGRIRVGYVALLEAQVWRVERFVDDPDAYPAVKRKGMENLESSYQMVEEKLQDSQTKWAVGNSYSIIDLYLLVFYRWGNRLGLDMRSMFSAWTNHVLAMLEREAVIKALDHEQISVWE